MQATGLILLLAAGVIVIFGGEQTTYHGSPTIVVPNGQTIVVN